MVDVGDIVYHRLRIGDSTTQSEYKGTVIYVHPKGRFYRAEFQMPAGKIIEGFQMPVKEEPRVVEDKHKRPHLAELNRNRWKNVFHT